MSRWPEAVAVVLATALLAGTPGGARAQGKAAGFEGIGRPATAAELAAWDIDVRPDFRGLPKGSGSVARGQDLWESKCASCHGVFGESTDVFTPIATGVTAGDIKAGRVAGLTKPGSQRSTLMKLATLSTLWDYIRRAMPWNAPRSLTVDEVYAATAYILNLADIVPGDFVLSDANIAQVQARMPNRFGMTTRHGLWLPTAKPDVQGDACMKDCGGEAKVASFLPDYAKNAHGNLRLQFRLVGAVRGVDTAGTNAAAAEKASGEFADIREIAGRGACLACHAADRRLVGPGFNEIAARYKSREAADAYLAGRIRSGGQGVWGTVSMPPPAVTEAEAARLARWILEGAPE